VEHDQWNETMLQAFLSSEGLDDMALILSITLMPSVLALLLASFALTLPEDSKS
jgi:hypothetical protein